MRSATTPIVLKLDGFGAHQCLDLIELAKNNFVELLIPPPHTSHITQELDLAVFGPVKGLWGIAAARWLSNNREGNITVKVLITLLATVVWPGAVTVANVQAGFRATGISPYNPTAFAGKAPQQPAAPSSEAKHNALMVLADVACDPEEERRRVARAFILPEAVQTPPLRVDRPLTRWLTCDEEMERLRQEAAAKAAAGAAAAAAKAGKAATREAAREATAAAREAADAAKYLPGPVVGEWMVSLMRRGEQPDGTGLQRLTQLTVGQQAARSAALARWKRKRGGTVPVQPVLPPPPAPVVMPPQPRVHEGKKRQTKKPRRFV